jgi:UDP-N-acetylmuramoylalanine--D-glutamate ligase
MEPSEIQGKKISVIGAARSGLAAAHLLRANGADVFVSDVSPAGKLTDSLIDFKKNGINFETGGHTDRVYMAEIMVVSPGVPSDSVVVREAALRNIRIVSELEMASWFCVSRIVGITGTNGKTTTATLAGRILGDAEIGSVVAGNIGTAFSSVAAGADQQKVAVLEISSFQLDHIETFRPAVSALLNITTDHLNRYGGSFEKYARSKCRIFENQRDGDALIYNADDPAVTERVSRITPRGIRMIPFGIGRAGDECAWVRDGKLVLATGGREHEIVETGLIGIPGTHNLYNAMAAALVGHLMGAREESMRGTLRDFRGVEHRLEFVREHRGVRYVNDSKATNVNSVWYALQSYPNPLVLILGGRDKGNDYSQIAELVKKNVRTVIAVGESADRVEKYFSKLVTVVKADSMQDAVRKAAGAAADGDIVLLSPACASFDWFDDYEHRGKSFKEAVWAIQ